ncbi:hypothetical protein ACJROX_27305 [Pseudalkalibacillus sp. A8]|uniref:hypothetical protein n=1 Tax=Pseudalkalibacillus sp. A8 TaxID=3382641 RepID=UPI0038B47994
MKITSIEPIKLQVHPKNPPRDGLSNITTRDVFLVKIHTDEGTYGIGEAFALGTLHTLEAIIEEVISPLLVGEDATNIEKLWEKMYNFSDRQKRHRSFSNKCCRYRPVGPPWKKDQYARV